MEMAMKNLVGVQVAYHKENSRLKYPVSSIESFRDKQTGHRYIVISPPASSKIEFYLGKKMKQKSGIEGGSCEQSIRHC